MLWIKSFHIVFVASWFAGLFYLPRIYVNLAMVPADSHAERERLLLMARKLMRFTTLLALPAVGFGLALWGVYRIGFGPGNGWMHAKWVVILLALGYHHADSFNTIHEREGGYFQILRFHARRFDLVQLHSEGHRRVKGSLDLKGAVSSLYWVTP